MFVTWKGDHSPRYMHVYRDGVLVVNGIWRITNRWSGRLRDAFGALIEELDAEGAYEDSIGDV